MAQDQTLSPSTVDAFVAAPEDKQREALGKMSAPAKTALLAALKQRKTANPANTTAEAETASTTDNSAAPPQPPGIRDRILNFFRPLDPAEQKQITDHLGLVGGNAVVGVSNALLGVTAGAGSLLLHPIGSIYGTAQTAADALNQLFPDVGLNPRQKKAKEASLDRLKTQWEQIKDNPDYAIGNLFGAIEGGKVIGDVAGDAIKNVPKASAKYLPRTVELAGEKVPVLVGEAEPESPAGRSQVSLKRSGTGSKQFEKVQQEQYAKIKDVIRKTAQQTSGLVGPMQEEPGAAMSDAATATFEAAKPMYKALDEELVTVPGDLHAASVLVKKAIARAKNYGYDFDAANEEHYGEEPLGMGEKLSEANQPLTTFMKIRSELGKMRAASSDGAFRHNITEEMKSMTDAMDKALDNTGLKDMWKEADRLWAKGYALREIADTLNSTTKGTPPVEQAAELNRVPTEMQGARLVDKLNELRRDGTLTRGFTPEEASNLRKSADILDRIQTTPVGRGFGESISQGRAIAHLLRGNAGPMIGAGLGFALTHTPVGAEGGAALGFIAQRIGERALVGIMTKTEGVKMLRALSTAKSPAQIGRAVNSIITYAGEASAVREKPKPYDEDTAQPPGESKQDIQKDLDEMQQQVAQ